jgi:hypothetical protein
LTKYKGLGTQVSSSPFFGHGYGVDYQEAMKALGSLSFSFTMNKAFQIFHSVIYVFDLRHV